METWMKVLSALAIVMMLIYLVPRTKQIMESTPKAGAKDWKAAIIPIVFVVLFILLLINSVR